MTRPGSDVGAEAFAVFKTVERPALSLRAGNALDDYHPMPPYDSDLDRPDDQYLRRHAYYGGFYLDDESRRFYLPALIAFAVKYVADDDGNVALVIETLLRFLEDTQILRSDREREVVFDCLTILAEHPDSKHSVRARELLEDVPTRL